MATTFEYSVRDRDGKVSKGRVEGDSKAVVAEKPKKESPMPAMPGGGYGGMGGMDI